MSNAQSNQDGSEIKTEGERVWDGEHFEPNGTIAVAYQKYHRAVFDEVTDKEIALASMNYAMTLYSAIGNCVARIKKFDFFYFAVFLNILWDLKDVVSHIVQEKMYEHFDSSQKEAFMAYLLMSRAMSPFSFFSYRKLAIELGEDVLSDDYCSHSTYLLAMARISQLSFYAEAKNYREVVWANVSPMENGEVIAIKEGWIDWKTVNRLARIIGDKEAVKFSAPLACSEDVMIKSGM